MACRRPGPGTLLLALLGASPGGAGAQVAGPAPYTAESIRGEEPPAGGIWVETLGLDAMFQRRGRPVAAGVSGPGRGGAVRPITLGGVTYCHGIGTQSISEFVLDVKGEASWFLAVVGLDDSATSEEATVNFVVWGDDRLLFAADTIRPGDAPLFVSVDLSGVRVLTLLLDDAQDVHARGLKLGIYSSPGPTTCQGLPGSWQHERLDAETWAEWGVDYLKHDYCGYSRVAADRSVAELRKPYDLMRDVLAGVGRDIVYSIGEYGWGDVWEWGESAGGHLWRTTGDLENSWANLESVGFRQAGREVWAGPGHWNDTDMLIVGTLSWGRGDPVPTKLTRNEQILHVTLWAIQAAPLMIGADLTRLDPWTVDLLTNDEVLDVTLDTLGVAGGPVWKEGRIEVWARPLHDGTWAVGLFNRGLVPYEITALFSDLRLPGSQPVRDLWLHEDLGEHTGGYTVEVPRHGAVMVKVGRPSR